MEDGLQPLRPLVEGRQVDAALSGVADRPRRRMAQSRQHHQPRSPACRRRKRGAAAQGIGRSRGGLSTKVHLVVDALGLPLTFEITEGQRHDSRPAKELIARVLSRCLLADKAYDSGDFRSALDEQGCTPVIASSGSRATRLPYDKDLYKALGNRVHVRPAQAGPSLRHALREDPAQLRGRGRPRMRAALATNLRPYSSKLWANLMSIDTTRTSISLPALCPASSSSLSRKQTSSNAAHSVAEPLAVR